MNYTTAYATDSEANVAALAAAGKAEHEDGNVLTTGESAFNRRLATSSVVIATTTMRLAFFRARKSGWVTGLKMFSAGTAAATVTTVQYGIFEGDEEEDLFTLKGSTANDTALFAATNTAYPKALSTGFKRTRGKLYAVGALYVGTTAPAVVASPALLGPTGPTGINFDPSPLSGVLAGSITAIPATFTLDLLDDTAAVQAPYVQLY